MPPKLVVTGEDGTTPLVGGGEHVGQYGHEYRANMGHPNNNDLSTDDGGFEDHMDDDESYQQHQQQQAVGRLRNRKKDHNKSQRKGFGPENALVLPPKKPQNVCTSTTIHSIRHVSLKLYHTSSFAWSHTHHMHTIHTYYITRYPRPIDHDGPGNYDCSIDMVSRWHLANPCR